MTSKEKKKQKKIETIPKRYWDAQMKYFYKITEKNKK